MKRLLLLSALLAGSAAPALADGDGGAPSAQPAQSAATRAPELPLSLTPGDRVLLGAPLTLHLEITTATGEEVSVPEQSLEPFEVVARRASETEAAGGGTRHTFELDVIALEPGELTLPKLDLRLVGPNGELSTRSSAPRTIHVASPLANEPSAQPKPLAEPVSVMEDDYTLAWLGGGVLATALVAAATLLIARALKRRKKPEPPPLPPPPAWVEALRKLSALSVSRDAMVADGRGAEFVEAVGNVARAYLGERYGFDGLERTTDELMRTLGELRPSELRLTEVALLLEQCDLVKFARVAPDVALCAELYGAAEKLVRSSMPGGPS
jgi:hypothetical protein